MTKNASPYLSVEYLPIGEAVPDPRNPRAHSERQIKQIARSIETFGFNVPVLIDEDKRILAGHGRVQAARRLGVCRVPVIRLGHLSDAQARAFAIADNRLTEIATWDDRLLGEVLGELAALELDFSLEVTGFSMAEIDLRIEGLTEPAEGVDPADAVPAMPDQPPVSRPGDLWLLGEHRIVCGDALDASCYTAVIEDGPAEVVFTDPPYNVPIRGHVSGTDRHREFVMASGEMTEHQFTHFLTSALYLLARFSTPGSLHYVCMDWRHMAELLAAGERAYAELENLCVWVKDSPGMGSFYRSQHELVFVFKSGAGRHRNNVQLGRFGRNRSNVWCYPGVNGFSRRGEEGNLLDLHPTVKPVALIRDALLDCSARGERVLDPFLGSGSTLIAAERIGRRCRGIEIDPLYVDTAIRRWQRYTGGSAVHAASGQHFDDIAVPREACHG